MIVNEYMTIIPNMATDLSKYLFEVKKNHKQ